MTYAYLPVILAPFGSGVVAGYAATYSPENSSNEILALRLLEYSSNSSADAAYSHITEYTLNSTTTAITGLPAGYAGVRWPQAYQLTYTISTISGANVITATLQLPVDSTMNTSTAVTILEGAANVALRRS